LVKLISNNKNKNKNNNNLKNTKIYTKNKKPIKYSHYILLGIYRNIIMSNIIHQAITQYKNAK